MTLDAAQAAILVGFLSTFAAIWWIAVSTDPYSNRLEISSNSVDNRGHGSTVESSTSTSRILAWGRGIYEVLLQWGDCVVDIHCAVAVQRLSRLEICVLSAMLLVQYVPLVLLILDLLVQGAIMKLFLEFRSLESICAWLSLYMLCTASYAIGHFRRVTDCMTSADHPASDHFLLQRRINLWTWTGFAGAWLILLCQPGHASVLGWAAVAYPCLMLHTIVSTGLCIKQRHDLKETAQTGLTSTTRSERRVYDETSFGRSERITFATANSHIGARQSCPVGRPLDPVSAGYMPLIASDSGTYRTSVQHTSAGRSILKPIMESQDGSDDVSTSTHSGPQHDERQVYYAMQQARRAVKEVYRYDRLLLRLCNGVFDALTLPDKLRFQQSNKVLRQNHQDSADRQKGLVEILLRLLSITLKCSQSGDEECHSEPQDAAVRTIRQQAAKLIKLNARIGAQRAALIERNEKVVGLESRLREHYEHILQLKDSIFKHARCISQRDETIASLRAQLNAVYAQHIRTMADMRGAHETTLLKLDGAEKARASCFQERRLLQRRIACLSSRPEQSIPAIAYNDESCGSAVSVSRGSISDESFVHELSDFAFSDSSEESDGSGE